MVDVEDSRQTVNRSSGVLPGLKLKQAIDDDLVLRALETYLPYAAHPLDLRIFSIVISAALESYLLHQ